MYSIRGFVGANGGGKTLAAVALVAIPAWKEDRPVMANFRLFPERLGFDPALYRPLRRWDDLLSFGGGSVIMDEITTVASSRASHRMPPEFQALLQQLRKADIELAWTAPAWARADLILRETTQAVTTCRGAVPDKWRRDDDGLSRRWFPPRLVEDGEPQKNRRAWWPNRYFVWRTFDAFEFDNFTHHLQERLRPLSTRRAWLWREPARGVYDTLEGVELMDHLTRTEKRMGRAPDPAAGRGPVSPRPLTVEVGENQNRRQARA